MIDQQQMNEMTSVTAGGCRGAEGDHQTGAKIMLNAQTEENTKTDSTGKSWVPGVKQLTGAVSRVVAASALALVLFAGSYGSADAQTADDDDICLGTAVDLDMVNANNTPIQCTAGDAVTTTLELLDDGTPVTDPIACSPGELVTGFGLRVTLVSTAQERYDPSVTIFTGGLSMPQRTAIDGNPGECSRYFIDIDGLAGTPGGVVVDPMFEFDLEVDADDPPNEIDLCGDLPQGIPIQFEVPAFNFTCVDTNDNGNADISTCTSWENNDSFKPNGTDNVAECNSL